jgi:uncharacterized membrane protein
MNEENFIFKLIGFVITLGIIYLIGAFIAWDTNPINWWLFKTASGRIVAIILLIFIVYSNFFYEDENRPRIY